MILIVMYDSPFVRRAAVTLHHYGLAFDRRPISVFRDFADVQAVNPLGRLPALALALDDGTMIADSAFILDHLDELAGPARALTPPRGPARLEVQGRVAVALGLMEKSVEYRTETYRRAPGTSDPGRVQRLEAPDRTRPRMAGRPPRRCLALCRRHDPGRRHRRDRPHQPRAQKPRASSIGAIPGARKPGRALEGAGVLSRRPLVEG